jgi:nucleoside phosphorylase
MPSTKTLSYDDYTVGWMCALPQEMAAAKLMLEETHTTLPQRRPTDHNTYSLGEIAGHNIVIACLPSGMCGTTSAAVVAEHMLSTFANIRLRLMVGVGGGVPSPLADIRLGDIVVSKPTDRHGGVVQYDYGKTLSEGKFYQTGSLNKPPLDLLTAISYLESNHLIGETQIPRFLSDAIAKNELLRYFRSPGPDQDLLFVATYEHVVSGTDCGSCDRSQMVKRPLQRPNTPHIHYGLIASGNQVMRDGQTRDRLGRELGILCFEMEAAGLMDHFPCLVIRGICDYADSHKNKQWQGYAALAAAAYGKELLSVIPTRKYNFRILLPVSHPLSR